MPGFSFYFPEEIPQLVLSKNLNRNSNSSTQILSLYEENKTSKKCALIKDGASTAVAMNNIFSTIRKFK